jgi:Tfp pilus assembly protein PilW
MRLDQFPIAISRSAAAVAVLLAAALAGCSGTRIASSWAQPGIQPLNPNSRVVAMAVMRDATSRRTAEDQMVQELRSMGAQAVQSYTLLEGEQVRNSSQARAALDQAGFEGAVVLRLVDVDREVNYVGNNYAGFPLHYRSFWGYYNWAWPMVYDPGYLTTTRKVRMETLVYSLPRNELLYAATSTSTDPANVRELVDEVADAVTENMKERGLLQASAL